MLAEVQSTCSAALQVALLPAPPGDLPQHPGTPSPLGPPGQPSPDLCKSWGSPFLFFFSLSSTLCFVRI